MRLIDADALITDLVAVKNIYPVCIIRAIEAAPTIEAAPVKRGKWKLRKGGSGTCDQCHFTQLNVWDMDNWDNFCAHCGADMRERIET